MYEVSTKAETVSRDFSGFSNKTIKFPPKVYDISKMCFNEREK